MRMLVIGTAMALAYAASAGAAERNATNAILAGDYAKAEQALTTERRIFPRRPEVMLNLAAVYRQTGRDDAARVLYADVLRREPVQMDMANDRTLSSHAVAQLGLARLSQLAAR